MTELRIEIPVLGVLCHRCLFQHGTTYDYDTNTYRGYCQVFDTLLNFNAEGMNVRCYECLKNTGCRL